MSPEAQRFISLLSPYINSYGYLVAFFGMMLENAGVPLPAETALVIISFFAGQGFLNIWLVIPIAIIGDVIGDNLGFLIGRFGGRPLIERYGRYVRIDRTKLDAMEALFKERGGRTVFTAHFFSTTRITVALVAGASHMRYGRFLVFNAAAAAVFVSLVAGVTFFFGKNLDATLRFFHLFRLTGLTAAVLIVTIYLYHFYQRKKHIYKRVGLKIIASAATGAILFGVAVYAISGALIVLPRAGRNAGLMHGNIKGSDFDVEHGFISDIGEDNILITALGGTKIRFSNITRKAFITVDIRNIKSRDTVVESGSLSQPSLAIDDLTLNFGIGLNPGGETTVTLRPEVLTGRFDFAVTGDTRDAGPVYQQIIASVNNKKPEFLFNAGDFVKDGEKRKYRAFLDQTGTLRAPLYTAIGEHELIDRGEPVYLRLFGPKNHSFTYRNSKFIVLDTSKVSLEETDLEWLSGELEKNEIGPNIFLITYAAPLNSERFTDLVARFKVKTVFSVKAAGAYNPLVKGVAYRLLEHRPDEPYSYELVHVEGNAISVENIKVVPQGLTIIDKIILAYEEVKREITNYLGG